MIPRSISSKIYLSSLFILCYVLPHRKWDALFLLLLLLWADTTYQLFFLQTVRLPFQRAFSRAWFHWEGLLNGHFFHFDLFFLWMRVVRIWTAVLVGFGAFQYWFFGFYFIQFVQFLLDVSEVFIRLIACDFNYLRGAKCNMLFWAFSGVTRLFNGCFWYVVALYFLQRAHAAVALQLFGELNDGMCDMHVIGFSKSHFFIQAEWLFKISFLNRAIFTFS